MKSVNETSGGVNLTTPFLLLVGLILLGSIIISPSARGKILEYSKLLGAEWLDNKKIPIIPEIQKHPASIIQFWASWCAGCGENMLGLSKVVDHFAGMGIKVGFFPVTIDDQKQDALDYFKLKNDSEFLKAFPFAIWDKNMSFANHVEIPSVPYFIIVDAKGEVKRSYAGHISDGVKLDIIKVITDCLQVDGGLKIIKEE